jgi:hypothetical protein
LSIKPKEKRQVVSCGQHSEVKRDLHSFRWSGISIQG